jgi:hypothetical protein
MAPNQDPAGLRRLLHALGYPRTAEFSVDGAWGRAFSVGLMARELSGYYYAYATRHASSTAATTNHNMPHTHHHTDVGELCKCVAWLEDRKVRLYDIGQRAPLRAPGSGWDAAFQQVCGWVRVYLRVYLRVYCRWD